MTRRAATLAWRRVRPARPAARVQAAVRYL